jgi:hypothetical protein
LGPGKDSLFEFGSLEIGFGQAAKHLLRGLVAGAASSLPFGELSMRSVCPEDTR